MEIFKELFEKPSQDLSLHLKDNNNERILFSGAFGSGKSTFLRHYFQIQDSDPPLYQEHLKEDEYLTVNISPVHYSVLSNEDIIRYLRYDILFELLKDDKDVIIESLKESFTPFETLVPWLTNIGPGILFFLLSKAPKVGEQLTEAVDKLSKVKDLFNYTDDINNTDSDKVLGYLKSIENDEVGIYAETVIDSIITELLYSWRERKNDGKKHKTVLIVDDLDRLDPDHIFRLFNSFSAHLENKENDLNKFGFDHIIFVCDIDNIKSIFHHRYGENCDFTGYANKFYSSRSLLFDNSPQVFEAINNRKILPPFKYNLRTSAGETTNPFSGEAQATLQNLIKTLVRKHLISLRTLVRYRNSNKIAKSRFVINDLTIASHISDNQLIIGLLLLLDDYHSIINGLYNLWEQKVPVRTQYAKNYCESVIAILHFNNSSAEKANNNYFVSESQIITYDILNEQDRVYRYLKRAKITSTEEFPYQLFLPLLLARALEVFWKRKIMP